MDSRFPLQSILDLSQLRLDEATRELGTLIAKEQEAGKRLQILLDYRIEYQQRFMATARQGITPQAWENYNAFLERLDAAVLAAQEIVSNSAQQTVAGQQNWQNKHSRVKAFDTLALRHQTRVLAAEGRRDQKTTDEFAARGYNEKLQTEDY